MIGKKICLYVILLLVLPFAFAESASFSFYDVTTNSPLINLLIEVSVVDKGVELLHISQYVEDTMSFNIEKENAMVVIKGDYLGTPALDYYGELFVDSKKELSLAPTGVIRSEE